MYLLVGLGNPGSKYKKNRHNVGHMTIDMIVKKYNFRKKNKNKFGDIFEGQLSNEKIFTLKPKDPSQYFPNYRFSLLSCVADVT